MDEELHNSTLSLKNTLSVTAPRASNESLPSHRYSTVPIQQPFSTFNLPLSDHMFDSTLTNSQKAFYYYLRGHLYNVLPFYSALAEENLAQAIKKNPTLIEAWNSLGECYWKKGDVIAAKDCFEGAIAYVSSKLCSSIGITEYSGVTRNLCENYPWSIGSSARTAPSEHAMLKTV